METRVTHALACVAAILLLCIAAPVAAQTAKPGAYESPRDRAIRKCKENRGADCQTPEGLREWYVQDRPITPEEQSAAAGARKHREECATNPKKTPNC